MRTTLNIDDQLYRKVKVRAALEGRTVTQLVETALRGLVEGLPEKTGKADAKKAKGRRFPTVKTRRLKGVQKKTVSIDALGDLLKEAELESDLERHEAGFRH